ncbi:type IV pili methyl-accepting chemotaxis transducer N-terminal domain-containing protein [Actibacterium sp. 188UL27-1]|uniref:type IV pili methyl-accepting chemotaxis transducer N-terminal domain-containing protein n=1 Tax=Actibacterium sp. 188UL27-1 TaxID=2786961 RepID=UPI00195C824B|nr:type IV pili methyl-accepting chemotaxis transducer N-terminal domain-containing protein [Actibacterium sp. 188UL27-1]MBM7067984.1 type IV pili methyl-accepting chemotaxis transducer N-terminal domain-containing protein [Actibacterium sp. 188UL27-1]
MKTAASANPGHKANFKNMAGSLVLIAGIMPAGAAFATTATSAAAVSPSGSTAAIQANTSRKQSIGGSERVDYSGRLHMLSQRVAASACMLKANQNPDISRGLMAGSASEVDRILDALEFGSARLKIVGAETRKKTLQTIHSFRDQWSPVRAAITDILENGVSDTQMATIENANITLLETATLLVSEISGQYSDPAELLQVDAIMVDISGRQRMRTQKMLKEACEIWNGTSDQITQEDFLETMDLFDVSLNALRDGMPDAGVSPAPTPKIREKLDGIWSEWQEIKAVLNKVPEAGELPADVKTALYLQMNNALIETNDVVSLYTKHAKYEY